MRAGRRYVPFVNPRRIGVRLSSIQPGVDWAVALVLTAAGLADVLHTKFAEPVWAGVVVTLFVFLPTGLRRRFPVAVFATVVTASFVLELALGDPANSKQYGF